MEMEYRVSDMELMAKASDLLDAKEYIWIRESYRLRNPRKYVNADTHRRIMQEAIDTAKTIISSKGTDGDIRDACLYLYICMDARKYRLNHNKARRDLGIDELIRKYRNDILSI